MLLEEDLKRLFTPGGDAGDLLTSKRAAEIEATLAPAAADPVAAAGLLTRLGLPAAGASDHNTAREYAAAVLEAHAGRREKARERFLHLVAALEQAAAWDGFVAASSRALALTGGPDFARALARAWEKAGDGAVSADALERAVEAAPDDHRLEWAAGFALDRAGRAADGHRHIARALSGYAQKKDLARVEEGLLHLVETTDPEVAESLLDTLLLITRHEGAEVSAPFWELAGDLLGNCGLGRRAWEFLHEHLSRHPDQNALRPAAYRAFHGVALDRGIPDASLAATGLGGTLLPTPQALARADSLLAWPQSLFVDHKYNGIGRIVGNDGETLRIQFPAKLTDLSMEIAMRSLIKLAPEDIKVRLVWDKDGLAREAAEDPASLVYAALVSLGGEGSANDLKRVLVPSAVSVAAWSEFWKGAGKAMKNDARIDLSQTARRLFRVAQPGAKRGAGLPEFGVKAPLIRRVETLERYLEENPDRGEAVAAAHAESIARLSADEPTGSDARFAGVLLLHRLGLVEDSAVRSACVTYFAGSEEFPPSVGKAVQSRCLALASEMQNPTGVYLAVLASRTKALRDEALDYLAAHLAEDYLAWILRLLRRSPERASAVLHIVTRKEFVGGWPAWDALLALVRIIAAPPRPAHQKQALIEIEENESLRSGLRDFEPEAETRETLRIELTAWRASERLLVPILDALDGIGRREVADVAREGRRGGKAAPAGGTALAAPAPSALSDHFDRVLMSAASLVRLKEEVHRVGTELKTSIPRAIETARAHGDLRENAEYEAAKDKQRRFAARLTELEEKLNRAMILDGSVVATGVAGPGTEIAMENLESGETETYWILGEGDDHHGEQVISYLAPIGKAVAGRRVGDQISFLRGGRNQRFRVLSVATKLPA